MAFVTERVTKFLKEKEAIEAMDENYFLDTSLVAFGLRVHKPMWLELPMPPTRLRHLELVVKQLGSGILGFTRLEVRERLMGSGGPVFSVLWDHHFGYRDNDGCLMSGLQEALKAAASLVADEPGFRGFPLADVEALHAVFEAEHRIRRAI